MQTDLQAMSADAVSGSPEMAGYIGAGLLARLRPAPRAISRVAAIHDLFEPDWFRCAVELFGDALPAPAQFTKYHWETTHILYALATLGRLERSTRVKILSNRNVELLAQNLARRVGKVTTQRIEAELSADTLYDVVIVPYNTLLDFGAINVFGLLEFVDVSLQSGGVCCITTDIAVLGENGAHALERSVFDGDIFDASIAQHTGLRLCGPFALGLPPRSPSEVDVRSETQLPHCMSIDEQGRITSPTALVYTKIGNTTAQGWQRVEAEFHACLQQQTPPPDLWAIAEALAPNEPPLGPVAHARFGAGYHDDTDVLRARHKVWRALAEQEGLDGATLTVPFYGQTRVLAHMGNDTSNCIYAAGHYEPNEFYHLANIVDKDMVALDVGANEGLYTCFLGARVGRRGRVIAIEPSERERRRLSANIALNGLENVRVMPYAVSDVRGKALLRIAEAQHNGQNTLGDFVYSSVREAGTQPVEVRSIDDIVAECGLTRVDVMKIDVDGLEIQAIRGARQTLQRFRPAIQMEISPGFLAGQGQSVDEILHILREFGYDLRAIDTATGLLAPLVKLEEETVSIFALSARGTPQHARGEASARSLAAAG